MHQEEPVRALFTPSRIRFTLALVAMALLVGSVCAAFLWSLDAVTRLRFAAPWLLYALPLIGAGVALLYGRFGTRAEAGNNLVLDEIHKPGAGVPLAMAPLIFIGTVATHLCGGSAGREGTAVQIGGSLAHGFVTRLGLDDKARRLLLMGGVAAGFGAVFGTPLAGAVFAIEVLALGGLELSALGPCLVAAFAADFGCRIWGIHHTPYPHVTLPALAIAGFAFLLLKAAGLGLACGAVARTFAEANHGLGDLYKRFVARAWLRPVIGGLVVIALTFAFGTQDYLGLGTLSPHPGAPTLPGFFAMLSDRWSWLAKLVFTVATLSAGFKGGEVTPLFFIGAGLGSALAPVLGVPVPVLAAVGMVALFGAAANTPVACAIMGLELFGLDVAPPLIVGCVAAYLASGHGGIYLSQRIARPKWPRRTGGESLRALREARRLARQERFST
jgi:H+/Cl- antiporter ClcA